ncbi:MAG: hypothetical protein ABIW38_11670 [Ferruginibacter sp.]
MKKTFCEAIWTGATIEVSGTRIVLSGTCVLEPNNKPRLIIKRRFFFKSVINFMGKNKKG